MVTFVLQDQLGLGGGAAGQQGPVQQQQPVAQQYNRSAKEGPHVDIRCVVLCVQLFYLLLSFLSLSIFSFLFCFVPSSNASVIM